MTLLKVFIWEFVPIYRFATGTLYSNTRQRAIPIDSSAPGVGRTEGSASTATHVTPSEVSPLYHESWNYSMKCAVLVSKAMLTCT